MPGGNFDTDATWAFHNAKSYMFVAVFGKRRPSGS